VSGILAIVGIDGVATGGFNPVTHPFPNNGTYTETIPPGATNIAIELYGASALGQHGNATAGTQGGGGGSGGYARSTYTVAAVGGVGKTFTITIAVGATANNTTIAAGTVTGFTAMTAPAGSAGTIGTNAGVDGTGGAAGATGTGGTITNSKGNAGQNGVDGGAGGVGIVGVIGSGRAGGNGTTISSNTPGGDGYAYFYYT
jgi:hypothetical protein